MKMKGTYKHLISIVNMNKLMVKNEQVFPWDHSSEITSTGSVRTLVKEWKRESTTGWVRPVPIDEEKDEGTVTPDRKEERVTGKKETNSNENGNDHVKNRKM